ncbi:MULTISPECIES: hypothetical protein [unclassified Streptomyces]|uniref:hypothetical protein n=1 Tax=unclassified Streptomyces TaxID=2593676 RepID=UPI0030E27078
MRAQEDSLVDVDRDEEDQRDAEADDRRVMAGGRGQHGGHGEPEEHVGRVLGDEHVTAEGGAVGAHVEEQRRQSPQDRQGRRGDDHSQQQVTGQ